MENLNNIAEVLKNQNDFLIASHENPDGDAIGSTAAIGHLLKILGKRFSLFNQSPIPEKFKWLSMPGPVVNNYQPGEHSWIIVLDCGNFERSGRQLSGKAAEPIINIDHHRGNPEFGRINWVDTGFSSVGEMLARLADHLNIKLEGPLAEALYLAVVSDTGFFSFGNTSSEVLELSARLIRNGIDPGQVNTKILNQWTIGKLHLQGIAMQKTLFYLRGRIGIVAVSKQMLDHAGATLEDCEGLANMVQRVKGVEVAISLREDRPESIKFSLRSTGKVNVQLMAAELEGGGHKNAAGGAISADMDRARERIIKVVARHLRG